MASVDGKEGMKLAGFLEMWTDDGTKLVEQERRNLNGAIWILYAVYFPNSTCDYGRHMAMLLKVDAKTDTILLHDLTNLTSELSSNYRQGIDEWFERHAGKY